MVTREFERRVHVVGNFRRTLSFRRGIEGTDVVLNEPLPESRFAAPAGTKGVTRFIDRVNAKTGIVGQNQSGQKEQPAFNTEPVPNGVSAEQPRSHWPEVLMTVCVLALIAAGALRHVQKSR